jgi:alanine-glyoxylate transaminase/serine-glyoxylate transaminase/serine-pyruvate transaminase
MYILYLRKVRGRVFRIGHLGDLNELMVLATLAGTEMAMSEVGIPIKLGSGNMQILFITHI